VQIHDNLLLLRYTPPCEDTIHKYMVKPRNPRGKSATWLPFLRNHLDVSWAIDFFTVTAIRFATLHVFLVLDHGRRKVIHWAITPSRPLPWVIQQLRRPCPTVSSLDLSSGTTTASMAMAWRKFLESCGIGNVRAYRCPWQNAYASRCTSLAA